MKHDQIGTPRDFRVGADPREWVKIVSQVKVTVTATIAAIRADGQVDVVKATESRDFSLPNEESGNTETRIPLKRGIAAGGGDAMELTKSQTRVVDSIKVVDNVREVYLYSSGNTDRFIVVTNSNDPITTLHLSELYWNLYDADPDYSFEIQPIPDEYVLRNSFPRDAMIYRR